MASTARGKLKSWAVHLVRVGLLALVLVAIHWQHARLVARQKAAPLSELPLAQVVRLFPGAERLGEAESHGGRNVVDSEGKSLGFVIQTSPDSDRFLGFSGPTNCLVGFDVDEKIAGVAILSSRDTRDHVELILRDPKFLKSWQGRTWQQAASRTDVDGVAGATLTSLAIVQGLQQRLGAAPTSLKFPLPLTLADAQALFPTAADIAVDTEFGALWHVQDEQGAEIGLILRTSPAADEIVGYQGPTETRIGIRPDGQIAAIAIGASFDNEPYVTYVRDDEYFKSLFAKFNLRQLSELDLQQARVEGVSGATMTSLAVARGLIKATQDHEAAVARQLRERDSRWTWQWRTAGTLAVVAFGIVLGLTRLRGIRWLRISFQLLLIAYLGFTAGDLLSLAMFAGWAQSGIPWPNAAGLILLAAAAFLLPIARGQNVYCSHLCPHGAAQQLLPRWWKLRKSLPRWLHQALALTRPALLAWAVFVATCHLPFSLVDIEPFDAYSWRAAAWPTIAIAIAGLIGSLFVPMAYCRYGCPTGALLEYLRRHGRSDRLTWADGFAAACAAGGIAVAFLAPTGGLG